MEPYVAVNPGTMSRRAQRSRKRVISDDDSESSSSEMSDILTELKKNCQTKLRAFRKEKKRKVRERSPSVSVSNDSSSDNEASQQVTKPDTFGLVNYEQSDSERKYRLIISTHIPGNKYELLLPRVWHDSVSNELG